MSEMVERVALALWKDRYPDDKWAPTDRRDFLGHARAAIEAMRKPTPHMVNVGWSLIRGNLRPDEIYPHMIDAALADHPPRG